MNKKKLYALGIAALLMSIVTLQVAFGAILSPTRPGGVLSPLNLSSFDAVVNTLVIGGGSLLTNSYFHMQGTVNSYLQADIQNLSGGTSASADLVLNNGSSSDTAYYGNLGFNGSGFSTSSFSICSANCLYLYASDGPTAIGTATSGATGILQFFTGGTVSSSERMRIDQAGNITFKGNLIAATSSVDTVSACGTSPSISGGNGRGVVITGSDASSTCRIGFATAFAQKPRCWVSSETTSSVNYRVTPATSSLIISTASSSAFISNSLDYFCF